MSYRSNHAGVDGNGDLDNSQRSHRSGLSLPPPSVLHTFDTTQRYTARRAQRNSLEKEWQEQSSASIFHDAELDGSCSSKANSIRFARQLVLGGGDDDISCGTEYDDDEDSVRTYEYRYGMGAYAGNEDRDVNLHDLNGAEPATYSTRHGRSLIMRFISCWTENVNFSKRTYIILGCAFGLMVAIIVGQTVGHANRSAKVAAPAPAPHNLAPHTTHPPFSNPEETGTTHDHDPDTFAHGLVSSLLIHFHIVELADVTGQFSSTPQRLAIEYLVGSSLSETELNRDHMLLQNWESTPVLRNLVELYVLAVLYHSTLGAEWLQDAHWLQADLHDPCSWYGVTCDESKSVQRVDLSGNMLSGRLPSEIQYLNSLTILNLSDNGLVGTLPLIVPSSLEILNLSQNHFESSIPNWDDATFLLILDLSENDLRGGIVGTMWESLTNLNLSHNYLTGALPTLPRLQTLRADNNRFTAWPSTMPTLYELSARENHFRGAIESLGQPSLRLLDVSENGLQGPLDFLLELTELRGVNVAQNKFTGTLPVGLAPTLTSLVAHHNQLTGFIALGGLGSLQELNLGYNLFADTPIPPAVSSLKSLQVLDLSHNALTGSIPSVSSLQLEKLYLQVNQLTGSLPLSYENIPTLKSVKLEENSLTGDVSVCDIQVLSADCELTCSCCTTCL